MEKQIILTDKAPAPIGPYSQAVKAGNTLYVSGQIPLNPETGLIENDSIETETHRVMKNIEALLTVAGFTFQDVVKSSIFIMDMNQFGRINEVYGSYFAANPPARETDQVACLPKNVNVEISVIAVKG